VSAHVIAFPARHADGERWEPWVDESAVARHFGVSARTVGHVDRLLPLRLSTA
jgi:hypothetical protein